MVLGYRQKKLGTQAAVFITGQQVEDLTPGGHYWPGLKDLLSANASQNVVDSSPSEALELTCASRRPSCRQAVQLPVAWT